MTDGTPRPDDAGYGDGPVGRPSGSDAAGASSASSGFSIAKLAFYALGAGVLVLIVSVPIIALCAHWSPIAGLVAALVAVAAFLQSSLQGDSDKINTPAWRQQALANLAAVREGGAK